MRRSSHPTGADSSDEGGGGSSGTDGVDSDEDGYMALTAYL